jgi:succinate dehydrogenase / fumarate reductase cytochrome b subunit
MALLGVLILVFIVTHMQNFWYKMKLSHNPFPLHTLVKEIDGQGYDEATGSIQTQKQKVNLVLFTNGSYQPLDLNDKENIVIKNGNEVYSKKIDVKIAEGYKDLHSLTTSFFGQDKSEYGFPANSQALFAVLFYVICMAVLAFHLYHGFSSAFQTMGMRVGKYKGIINSIGKFYAIVVPALFAIIPLYIYFTK